MKIRSNELVAAMATEKIEILGPFWSYQLNNTANTAYIQQKWTKWAELAVVFSWHLLNGSQDFDFFQML